MKKLVLTRTIALWMLPLLLSLGAGCASYDDQIRDYRLTHARGDMAAAMPMATELLEDYAEENTDKNALVAILEAANTARVGGDILQSQRQFARAERVYEMWQQKARISLSREGLSLFTNPATLPYRGSGSEIIMINIYQALNTLRLGDIAGARQPLMRLYTHQKQVVTDNAERIAKERETLEGSAHKNAIASSSNSSTTRQATQSIMADLPDTRGYELYANPFAEYLFAFYHLYAGVDAADREIARTRLNRALAMAPNNTAVRQDVERLAAGTHLTPSVYLIHETGMAPYLEEFALMLPIYAGKTFSTVSIALPRQDTDKDYTPFASISGAGQSARAELLCDMDAVITQEYKNDYPGRLTRAIASATAKAAAAYAANYAARKSDNGIVQVATLVTTTAYQFATNTADTRSWVTLPKQIGLCRIDLPKDRRVKLNVNGRQVDVDILNDGDVHVIYLRTMHSNSTATVWQFKVR